MALTFEQVIAGAPPTGGDSGSEVARKINDNFTKTKNEVEGLEGTVSPLLTPGSVILMASNSVPSGFLECDGSAVNRTTYASLYNKLVTSQGFIGRTCTITIASPAVLHLVSHGFTGGERIRFSTTGALPTGLSVGVDYYVVYAGAVNPNDVWLSATPDGDRIITSGTQSGVHTVTQSLYGLGNGSTTFNIPDLRGEFIRGWDHAKGTDILRSIGTIQRSTQVEASTDWYGGEQVLNGENIIKIISSRSSGGSTYAQAKDFAQIRPRNISMMYCIKY